MVDGRRTLIVGGGIAGLTLAAALHRQGFEVSVIERNPTWHTLGAGMAIQPNAMRALRALELDGAVADRGTVLHRLSACLQPPGECRCRNEHHICTSDPLRS